jgi:hypothetical protein
MGDPVRLYKISILHAGHTTNMSTIGSSVCDWPIK